MDLSALLQGMTQGLSPQVGDPAVPFAPPPPMAPPMPQAMPQAPPPGIIQPTGPDWKAQLPMLLTAIAGLAGAGNNPLGAGAYLRGFQDTQDQQAQMAQHAAELAQQEADRQAVRQERMARDDEQRRQWVATTTANLLEKGAAFETPEEQAAFFQRMAPVLGPLGIDTRALAGMPNPTAPKRLVAEATTAFEKAVNGLSKNQGVDLTVPGAYDRYSVTFRGKTMSLADLSTLAGLPVAGADAPRKSDEPFSKDAYGSRLQREVLAQEKVKGRPLTPAEVNQVDDTLRKSYTRLDDKPDDGTLAAIRAMTLSNLRRDAAAGGLTPVQRVQNEAELRKEWTKTSAPVREMERQLVLMRTGLDRALKGDPNGGSQAVMVTFQKILDPTSVVREGEYARTAEGQAFLNRIQGTVDRVTQGGTTLTPKELAALVETAAQFTRKARASLSPTQRTIASAATDYGLNPGHIFNETGEPGPVTTPSVLPRVGDIRTLRNGTKVRITSIKPDGSWSGEEVP